MSLLIITLYAALGCDNPGSADNVVAGAVAGDEESYSVFADLFDPMIAALHNGYAKVQCVVSSV